MSVLDAVIGEDGELVYDRQFQVLLLASICSPLGSSVVSPLLDSLAGVYGVPETQIGLLMAVFTAPSVVFIPVVGLVSDRYGRKPVLTAGLLLFGLGGLGLGVTTDFRLALAARAVQGVGYTGIAPILIASVGDQYSGAREATAQGLRFTAVGLSLSAAPVVAGVLAGFAWQYPFALFVLAVLTSLVVAVGFVEPSANDRDAAADRTSPSEVFGVLTRPPVLATVVGRAVPSFLWFAFLTYVSIVVVQFLGGTPGLSGGVVGTASLASAVAGTQVGRVTAHFRTRLAPLLGATACCGGGLALFALAPSLGVAFAAAAVIGSGFGVGLSLYRSTLTGVAAADVRGTVVSVGESVGRAGSTAAPVVAGAGVAAVRAALGPSGAITATLLGIAVAGTTVGVGCAFVAERSV